jgi:phytoene dehydrogenase-like protein
MTTLQALQKAGFSAGMIDSFFRPFLGGIFLEPELDTSSRFFHFVFRMFATGSACLPAAGMEAVPRQLAANLPAGSIRLGARVTHVAPGEVTLSTGEVVTGNAVVVATDGPAAARLLGAGIPTAGQGVTNLYFAAPEPPVAEPILVLNGEGTGPINNLCVPTVVAPAYGPSDQALVSVSVLGTGHDAAALESAVRQQLGEWYGPATHAWRHLRTYTIPYALPRQAPPALDEAQRPVRWQPGFYLCGDHRDTASIQGAMVSGRRAAAALIEDAA